VVTLYSLHQLIGRADLLFGMDGARHVFESQLKERRRTGGRSGHERRPPDAYSDVVESERMGRSRGG
jgi:hypothetical protein